MNERKDNRWIAGLFLVVFVALVLWVILLGLKAEGAIDMHWALVGSGLFWISWLILGAGALVVIIVWQLAKLKRWYRQRKRDRRIIRQAKAAGVWEKPKALGGRALELKAWKDYKLKRLPGESDKELRLRYMTEVTEAEVEKCGF